MAEKNTPKGGGSNELPPEVAAALSDEAAKQTERVYLDASDAELEAEEKARLADENAELRESNADKERRLAKMEAAIERLEKLNSQFIAHGGPNAQRLEETLRQDHALRAKQTRFAMFKKIREEMGNEVVITIQPGPDPARNWDVPVSYNGNVRKLPRGVPVKVSSQELEVLFNAIEDTDIWVRDESGVPQQIKRHHLSYPFTIHDTALQMLENAASSVGVRL